MTIVAKSIEENSRSGPAKIEVAPGVLSSGINLTAHALE